MSATHANRSIPEVFSDLVGQLTTLFRKEAELAAEEKQNALFDKRLAQEEVWIRQGVKARRTRNEGRVKALKQMSIGKIPCRIFKSGTPALAVSKG